MKRFRKILCLTDISEDCTLELERAAQLVEHNQGTLTVAALVKIPSDSRIKAAGMYSGGLESCKKKIEEKVEPYRKHIDIKIKTLAGRPYLEIIRDVLRENYDLVIKIQSAAYWKNGFFNHTDMQLLGKCPCPVWLVNANKPKTIQKILAIVDVSNTVLPSEIASRTSLNRRILEIASTMAIFNQAELHVAQAWHLNGESAMRGPFIRTPEDRIMMSLEEKRKQYLARLDSLVHNCFSLLELPQKDRNKLVPQIHLVKGWEHKEVPTLAKQLGADLVILGAIARALIADVALGNTSKAIFRQLEGSFLLIKQSKFVGQSSSLKSFHNEGFDKIG